VIRLIRRWWHNQTTNPDAALIKAMLDDYDANLAARQRNADMIREQFERECG